MMQTIYTIKEKEVIDIIKRSVEDWLTYEAFVGAAQVFDADG